MRKVSLTKQLIFIYTLVLLITTITFNSVLSGWLFDIYTNINHTKLEDFSYATKLILESGVGTESLRDSEQVEFIIFDNVNNTIKTSSNVLQLINSVTTEEIYTKLQYELESKETYRGQIDGEQQYFYTATKTINSQYYIFTISSGKLINQMRQDTSLQIMGLFFIILIGGGLIVAFWSNILVKRIGSITDHVKVMPLRNYSSPYIDNGVDEIAELSSCIESMRSQIYENEETKREIIQNLSHDIKTPLAVIKSYAEAIADHIEGPESGLLIIKQTNMLQHKVEKLLELNRLNYLEKDQQFEKIKLRNVIEPLVDNLKYLSEIKFELSLDDSIFLGYADNYHTIIENILSNALRYAKTTIKITLEKSVLTIYNDGEHIAEKFLDAQFKAYEKGDKGIFGVGMSIVKKTVDFFELDLRIENRDPGVAFIIENRNPIKNN